MIAILLALLATVTGPYAPAVCACQVTTCAVNFPYQSQIDLYVTSTTAAGVATVLTITTDYTLNVSSTVTTATLTLNNPAAKCPAGSTLKIARNTPNTQPTSFKSQINFQPSLHEKAYDRGAMISQEIANTSQVTFKGMISVTDFASFGAGAMQAAINSVGVNGTVYVPAGYAITLTSGLTISNSGVTLKLEPSAVLTKGFNGKMLTITGNNVTVDGGVWDGNNGAGYTLEGIFINGADGTVIKNATVKNQGAVAGGAAALYLDNATNFRLEGNTISGAGAYSIYGVENTQGGIVTNNRITIPSGANEGIKFYSLAGKQVKNITISNNSVITNAVNSFCYNVEPFGGTQPTGIIIQGNRCINGAASYGAISIVANDAVVSGNFFDSAGFTSSIAGIELVKCSDVSVTGNQVIGAGSHGIWLNDTSNTSVVGNVVDGFGTVAGTGGIVLEGPDGAAHNDANIVSGNKIKFPPAGTQLNGIYLLTGNAGASFTGNSITGNVVIGNGQATTICINISRSVGTMTKTLVMGNMMDSCATGINNGQDDATQDIGNIFGASITARYLFQSPTNLMLDETQGMTASQLGSFANGSRAYCTDCLATSPCAGGGSGAWALRLLGVWNCGSVTLQATTPGTSQAGNINIGGGSALVGSLIATTVVQSPNGTAAAPAFTSASETSAGLFFSDDGVASWTGIASGGLEKMRVHRLGTTIATTLQANLGAPANGTIIYCSDCNTASACTAGGTGALASRQNGAWKCL